MNLWIVNQYAITPAQAGPMRHYDLAYELVQRGHTVTIIASSFDHFSHAENRLAMGESHRVEMVDGIRYLWIRSPDYSNNGTRRIWNMLHFAVSIMMKSGAIWKQSPPDVIIGSSPTLFAALAAQRLARKHRIPFVLEIRDLWPKSLVELGNVPEKHPIVLALAFIERHLYRSADHVISLLPGAMQYIVRRGARADAVSWLPNGVKLHQLEPIPESREKDKPFTVLYAGAHGTANGLDSVLDAAALLDKKGLSGQIQIHMVGNGPQKLRLQARTVDEKVQSMKFFDEVPKKMVAPLMAQADALLLPLRKADLYGFGISPNKLYHYMAAARPVVFATGSCNNPVQDADAGITVPAEDPHALVEGIQHLASLSEEERRAMGQRGRTYVEEHHRIERLAQDLERILVGLRPTTVVRPVTITEAT